MYLMHWGFRRDLAAFAAAVPVTPVADRRAWSRLSRRFALFAGVLHKHHTGEDAGLWPLLAERGADPPLLDALEAEHAVIHPPLAGPPPPPSGRRGRRAARPPPRCCPAAPPVCRRWPPATPTRPAATCWPAASPSWPTSSARTWVTRSATAWHWSRPT